jgi:uncharacterized delta-60 repeat protein
LITFVQQTYQKLNKKMKLKNSLFAASVLGILLCMSPGLAHSQAGFNDSTFNISDVGTNKDPRGASGTVFCSLILPNGKILIGGNFVGYNGRSINGIARLNSDGSLDNSFHSGIPAYETVNFILLQSNNKLIIGGDFTTYNGAPANHIVRINANGNLDASFSSSPGVDGSITKAVLESSGKILILGDFTQVNTLSRKYIARLNANGNLDLSFNYTDATPHVPTDIALQADGKPVVAFTDTPAQDNLIARLNTNGSIDPTFAVEDRDDDFYHISLRDIAIQADGKIVVAGTRSSGIETVNAYCQRVNADGSTDVTFHPAVTGTTINAISIQSNGKIVLSGIYKNNYIEKPYSNNTITRLNVDGSKDLTFNNYSGVEGADPSSYTRFSNYTTSIQPDGKIIMGGFFKHPQKGITRLNSDGGVDINFNKVTGANGRIKTMLIQSNGKILIGGSFSSYNGVASKRFTRLNGSGSLDASFNNKVKTIANAVNCIALQANQKIIVGGAFTLNNGTQFNNISRLNANGNEDATFNTGNVVLGNVLSINVQADDKILISGSLDSYNGTPAKGIIRLNQNGTVDPTFVLTNTVDASHAICKFQSDGKIIVGNYERLYRLNANGSLDPTFSVNTWFEFIEVITVQDDGKIIVGGNNPVWNDRGFVVRLNSNGSIDDSFTDSRNLERVVSITVLQNHKIILGRGESVCRLNPDGTLDSLSLLEGNLPDGLIWCSAETADGKVILGGDFTTYQDAHRNGIARVFETVGTYRTGENESTLLTDELDDLSILTYPNPATVNITIDNLIIGSTVTILNTLGQVVIKQIVSDHKTTIETSAYQNGVYFIHAEYNGKASTGKFIVNNN